MFPLGVASLTETTILSPTEAYLLLVPPKTRITKTSFAPVLSATFILDSCYLAAIFLITSLSYNKINTAVTNAKIANISHIKSGLCISLANAAYN